MRYINLLLALTLTLTFADRSLWRRRCVVVLAQTFQGKLAALEQSQDDSDTPVDNDSIDSDDSDVAELFSE